MEEQTIEEIKQRVITGNAKTVEYWNIITEKGGDDYKNNVDKYEKACQKLHGLCQLLKLKGFNDCLYMDGDRKTKKCFNRQDGSWCTVCPAKDEIIEKARNEDNAGKEQMELF